MKPLLLAFGVVLLAPESVVGQPATSGTAPTLEETVAWIADKLTPEYAVVLGYDGGRDPEFPQPQWNPASLGCTVVLDYRYVIFDIQQTFNLGDIGTVGVFRNGNHPRYWMVILNTVDGAQRIVQESSSGGNSASSQFTVGVYDEGLARRLARAIEHAARLCRPDRAPEVF
jgi:hypothetical protein